MMWSSRKRSARSLWRSADINRIRRLYSTRVAAYHRGKTDSEAPAQNPSPEAMTQKQQFLQTVFGPSVVTRQSWPGAQCFLNFIEGHFDESWNSTFRDLFEEIGLSIPGDHWQFLARVAGAIGIASPKDPSIDEILAAILERPHVGSDQLSPGKLNAFRLAVFKSLSLLTLIFDVPNDGSEKFSVDLHTSKGIMRHEENTDSARRPISRLIQEFPHLLPTVEQVTASIDNPQHDQIYAANLSFHSLRLMSKVKIHWSDVIGSHLHFDPLSRTLSLFRFPSFCALSCLKGPCGLDTDFILAQRFKHLDGNLDTLVKFKREILLSYRLLFGHTMESRSIFRSYERKRVAQQSDQFDPLLDILCGASHGHALKQLPPDIWPDSCVDHNGRLIEQDTYSIALDFPMLAPRVLSLQEFDLRQQPSRIRDLWRDRRQPLQWYAFWAVLIIGGATVLLSLLQLIVSCLQLAWTIR